MAFLNCADLNLFSSRGSLSSHNCISNSNFYKLEMPFFFSPRISMNQLFKTKFNQVLFFLFSKCVFPGPAKKHDVAIELAELSWYTGLSEFIANLAVKICKDLTVLVPYIMIFNVWSWVWTSVFPGVDKHMTLLYFCNIYSQLSWFPLVEDNLQVWQ